jgi:hypothetical protein
MGISTTHIKELKTMLKGATHFVENQVLQLLFYG